MLRATQDVTLDVLRGDDSAPQQVVVSLTGSPSQLGLAWRHDSAEPTSVFVTRVLDFSPAARAGIRLQDRILAFQGEPIAGQGALLERVKSQLEEGAERLSFDVESNGRIRTVEVDMRLPVDDNGDASY